MHLCMQAKKAAKVKKVVQRLDSDADDSSMDDDSGDSDFGAPKKVPLRPSVGEDLITCQQPHTYIAGMGWSEEQQFLNQRFMQHNAHLSAYPMSIAQCVCRQEHLQRSQLPKLQHLPRHWLQLGGLWRPHLPLRSACRLPGEIQPPCRLQCGTVRSAKAS